MANSKYKLFTESTGICLICLNNCEEKEYETGHQIYKRHELPFKLIMRYLEIDVNNAYQNFSSVEESEAVIVLCDKCETTVNQFGNWYQDFEKIRLFMTTSIRSLKELIKESENCGKSIQEGTIATLIRAGNPVICVSDLDELRQQIYQKCSAKLMSSPRIKLEKLENIPKHTFDESTLKRDIDKRKCDERIYPSASVKFRRPRELVVVKEEPNESEKNSNLNEDFSVVKIPSKVCFLCLNHCGEHRHSIKNPNSISFKVIMQYLGVDISTIAFKSLSINQSEVEVLLCHKCDSLFNQFWEWYKYYDIVRLYLDNCIQMLCDVVKQSGNGGEKEEIQEEIICSTNKQLLNILRNKISQKCSQKLKSLPRVTLEKIKMQSIIKTSDFHQFIKQEKISMNEIDVKVEPSVLNTVRTVTPEEIISMNEITVKMEPFYITPVQTPIQDSYTVSAANGLKRRKTKIMKEKLTCGICLKTFSTPGRLYYHTNTHGTLCKKRNRKKPVNFCRIRCHFCQKSFLGKPNTDLHMITSHTYQFFSDKIPKQVSEPEFQEVFQKLVSKGKSYGDRMKGCPFCTKSVRDDVIRFHILNKHFNKVLLSLENSEGVSLQPTQDVHIIVKKRNLKDFGCERCGKTFTSRDGVKKHLKHQRCQRKKHMCKNITKLDKELAPGATEPELETGLQTSLNQQKHRKLECVHCNMIFKKQHQHRNHMIARHILQYLGTRVSPGTTKRSVENVISFSIAPGEKFGWGCILCGSLYNKRSILHRHILIHHEKAVVAKLNNITAEVEPSVPQIQSSWSSNIKAKYQTKTDPICTSVNKAICNSKNPRGNLHEARKVRQYTCYFCMKVFLTFGALYYHKKSHQNQAGPLQRRRRNSKVEVKEECKFCPLILSSKMGIQSHMLIKHSYQFVRNNLPEEATPEGLQYAFNMVLNISKKYPNQILGCPYCPKSFEIRTTLKTHVLKDHLDKIIVALENPEKSPQATQLVHSLKKVFIKFACKICNQQFTKRTQLRWHVLRLHSKAEKKHLCSLCGNKFFHSDELHRHHIFYHTITTLKKELPPESTEIEVEAAIQNIIDESNHIPGFKVNCIICNEKSFTTVALLRKHILFMHLSVLIQKIIENRGKNLVVVNKFKCVKCKESFCSWSLLVKHKKTLCLPPAEDKTQKGFRLFRYPCNYCDKLISAFNKSNHTIADHPFETFSPKLPFTTTEDQFLAGVQVLLDKRVKYLNISASQCGCPYCNRLFKSVGILKIHLLKIHFDKVLIALQNPKDESLQKLEIERDFATETGSRKLKSELKCEFCAKTFWTEYGFRSHMKVHIRGNKLECSFCEKSFVDEDYLKKHTANIHTFLLLEDELPQGTTSVQLEAAILTMITSTDNNMRECSICQKSYHGKKVMRKHVLDNHLENVKETLKGGCQLKSMLKYHCRTCGERFHSKFCLTRHLRTHYDTPFRCSYCTVKFRKKIHQSFHVMVVHTVEYLHEKGFPGQKKDDLDSKWRTFRSSCTKSEDGKRWNCSLCPKEYAGWNNLKGHVIQHHREYMILKEQSV